MQQLMTRSVQHPSLRRYTFPKSEHLCLRKQIETLFGSGSTSRSAFPLRAVWRLVDAAGGEVPALMMVSVSKRRLRHAVSRNRVKRCVREAYRLNKHLLSPCVPEGKQLHIAFLWMADGMASSARIRAQVVRLLQLVAETLQAAARP